jgi:hypothetical protein
MTLGHFEHGFDRFACIGDTIEAEVDGFLIVARLEDDRGLASPDKVDEGFWPSLDPSDPGYIGPKSPATLRRHMKRARAILEAWERGEWSWCGVVLSIYRDGVLLDGHAASLWGLALNFPAFTKRDQARSNCYLTECAEEMIPEALDVGRAILSKLTERNGK